MKNEKANARHIGSNTDIKNELTMNSNTPNQNKFQFNSRRELLEQAKLSRLPKLSTRPKFELPEFELSSDTATAAVCVGCGGRLDGDDNFQQSIKVCRKCLAHYEKIDSAIDEASKRKRRELLERFVGGAK